VTSEEAELRTPCATAILEVLTRHVSVLNARSVLRRAIHRAGLRADAVTFEHVGRLADGLGDGLRLFVRDPAVLKDCIAAVVATGEMAKGSPGSAGRERGKRIVLRAEMDVVVARMEGRTLARDVGFTEAGRTRVATVISELARNIVRYAGEGEIEIQASSIPAPTVDIVAKDRGPGIADLEAILSGNYRSKDGMGLGLRGVRNVSSRFDVKTGRGIGTTVTVRMEGC
jgi:serine/threonine-protein kinase RsbT